LTLRARLSPIALLVAGLALAKRARRRASVADFYRGRTINFCRSASARWRYDLYARVISRHIGRHIPGNPIVVVQNMDGAGSVRASNYVYAVAPKDGTVIAAVNQNMPMYQLLGGAGAQFDAEKLVGSAAWRTRTAWSTRAHHGVRTIDDAKTQLVPLGAVGTRPTHIIFRPS